jgi:hypothetical protein
MAVSDLCSDTWATLLLALRGDYYAHPTGISAVPVLSDMTEQHFTTTAAAFSFLGVTVQRKKNLLVASWKNKTDADERRDMIQAVCHMFQLLAQGKRYADIQMCCNCPVMERRSKIIKGVAETFGWRVVTRPKLCLRVLFYKHKKHFLQGLQELSSE